MPDDEIAELDALGREDGLPAQPVAADLGVLAERRLREAVRKTRAVRMSSTQPGSTMCTRVAAPNSSASASVVSRVAQNVPRGQSRGNQYSGR